MPRLSRQEAYIVNCAISPLVSLVDWQFEIGGGLGGSAAYALLQVSGFMNCVFESDKSLSALAGEEQCSERA